MTTLRLLLLLGALLLGAAAHGQQATRPNLSGFWAPITRGVSPQRVLLDRLAPKTVLLPDTGAAELPVGDFGGLSVRPKALDAALRWKPVDDMALDKVCAPPSIIYAMQGPFPMEIHQATELTVFKLEYYDMVRIVFTDGRSHPPADAPHSKVGHSVGRWESDIFIVDTTHLSAATITNNGLEHSDNVRVLERFKLSDDGTVLYATQEFEDPAVLENRGARFMAWRRAPEQYVLPYECDPTFALEYLKR
jgi:hypothetical protein